MSRNRGHKNRHYGNSYRARDVSVTNVTNVTNVSNVTHVTKMDGRRPKRWNRGCKESPPELMRFFHSAGLVDGHKAARMDPGRLGYEAGKVAVYDAKKAWGCVEDMGHNVCEMGSGLWQMGEGVVSLAGCLCKAVGSLFK